MVDLLCKSVGRGAEINLLVAGFAMGNEKSLRISPLSWRFFLVCDDSCLRLG